MEGGKRIEAGPSTTGEVGEKEERPKKMAEKAMAEAVIDYEAEEEEDNGVPVPGFVPGPLLSLKEQIEKDQDDDSLRRWKEKLLGCVEGDLNGQMEPEVKFQSIAIISSDFGEINTPLPVDDNRSGQLLFTLKEGSQYQFKLTFNVLHNIVSGLTYSNTVWKGGLQVDQSKGMLGTFAPHRESYVHTLEVETTPSGLLARGIYTAQLKVHLCDKVQDLHTIVVKAVGAQGTREQFSVPQLLKGLCGDDPILRLSPHFLEFEDDDRRCHMDLKYSFEIKA